MSHPLLKTLAEIGIHICIQDERLRLTGNLEALTDDMKAALHCEKAAIIAAITNPYPNEAGLVTCDYCLSYRDHRCTRNHQVDGSALLRACGDFRFNQAAYDDFYANQNNTLPTKGGEPW